jgi:hypothetical protein
MGAAKSNHDSRRRPMGNTHKIDIPEAEERGWKVEPMFLAVKGRHRFDGPISDVLGRISTAEEQEQVLAEQAAHRRHRAKHEPIDKLIRSIVDSTLRSYKALEKYEQASAEAWANETFDVAAHKSAMRALDEACRTLERATVLQERLLSHDPETLLENELFVKYQGVLQSEEDPQPQEASVG